MNILFIEDDAIELSNEIYRICDVQITQTEFIISVMAPTVLQLI